MSNEYLDAYNSMISGAEKPQPRSSYYQQPGTAMGGGFGVGDQAQSSDGEYGKGLMRSFAEIPGLLAGTGAYLADIVGADNARDAMLGYAKKSNQEVQDKYGSDNASFSDVLEGKGSFGGFVKNASGYVTGQALQFLLTGGIGAGVARGLLKGGAVAAADKLVASELAKGASEEAAKKVAADFMVTEAKRAGLLGATTAGGAQNFNMELGSIYPEAVDQAKSEGRELDAGDKFRVGAAAFGAAATDTAMDRLALGKVMGGSKSGGNVFSRAAREIPGGALRESTTEGIQTEIERYGAGKSLTDADAMRDVIDSAAVGALGGVQAGALTSLHKAPVPPELQHVADKAAEANSPLSKAAMAGNAGVLGQAAATQNGNDQTQSGAVDPISQRATAVEQQLSGSDILQKLRELGPQMGAENLSNDFLYALQVARDPRNRQDVRQQAMDQVEQAIQWTQTGFTMPKEAPQQPGTAVALRENNAVGPVGQAQFFDPNTIDGEAVLVDNMISGPRSLPGPQRGLTAQQEPTQEQAAPAVEPVASPVEQQNVAPATANVSPESATVPIGKTAAQAGVSGMTEVQAPRVEIPAGTGPAVLRKRAAVVKQLAENGFETVQRDGKDFYMVNAKTGQKFKLDGPADAQLARKAINDRIDAIAHTAAASPKNELKEPTQAQIDAGNYKKSDVIELNGMKIKIENPQGSVRRGVGPDGKAWETKMAHHYGEFQGTVGADGDKLDVFLGPRKDSDKVYVIDQVNKDGSFDEHKVMMGFTTEADARQGYLANYEKGWTGLGAITEMSPEQFREWAKSRAAKKPAAAAMGAKPAAQSKPLEAAAAASQEQFTEAEKAEETTFFYVKDGEKSKKLKKVKKSELPKKSSVRRDGGQRELTQDDLDLLEAIAGALGKTVQAFESQDGDISDGFVNPGNPNEIFVDKRTSVNPMAVFGHEFFHTLKETDPQAWESVAKVVKESVGQEAYDKMMGLGYAKEGAIDEIVSDLGGNLMMDPKFWREVLATAQKDHGKDAKGVIARIAALLDGMLERVLGAIKQGGFSTGQFVTDADAVRAAFRDALAAHIKATGVSKTAMDAEIKKSVKRVSESERARLEYAEVEAKYRGTDQWMKAPNGQPTQLSERQWIQVRTPSFKNWFGDWEAFAGKQGGVWSDDKGEVSKVVDDNGEPLVVYHGTTKGGFSEFKTPGGKVRGDLGIFTTPNLEMAKTYNKRGRSKEIEFADMEREPIEGGDTPGYYASFVNIRKPYETDFAGAHWNGERPGKWVVVDEEGATQLDKFGNEFFDMFDDANEFAKENGGEVEPAPDHWETTDSAVREARSNRNDGAIIRSVIDDGGGYSSYIDEPSDVFVALNPNQLKSATQNTGEFSKSTADMRFSRKRTDVDPDGYNEFTATPEDVALADAYEAKHGIRPYLTVGQLQVPVELPSIRKSVKREHSKKNLEKGYIYHPIFGVPLNKNGTVTLYFPTTNEDARRVARERTLKAPPGSNRVYLTNESAADVVAAKPGNISILGDDIQANVLIQVDPSLLQMDTEHEDGRIDFFIPIAEGDAFKGKMSQVKLFNMFAERAEPITREKTLKDIERSIEEAMSRIENMPEGERKKLVTKAKAVLKQEHNVGTLLSENGKLQKTRAGEYDLKHYEGDSVASLGLGLASAQQITEKLSSCPQHANCESLCLGDTSGQNLLYGGEGPFRAGPRLSQYLKTEAMVLHPEEFALVLHHEIKLLESWARKETGFETTKDEKTGETIKTPKQLYQPSIRLNVTSDFRPITWAPIIKAMPGVEFYDYTKLDTKPIAKNHHLTYSSDGVAQVVDGVVIGNGNYNWDRMLRQMRNGFNVAMAFSDKNSMPKFLVDGSTGERFQVWNGDNYDARFLDPKPGQDGNLFNKGMIIGLTNKDRTKSGLAIMLEKQGPASATKAQWTKLINDIASDDRFINDKSVPYVLKWVSNQKGQIERSKLIEFADSPAVKHNGFFMDYNPKRDGDTVVVADQERTKEAYKAQQPKVFEVARFSRKRDEYNQRIATLKDLISCLKK